MKTLLVLSRALICFSADIGMLVLVALETDRHLQDLGVPYASCQTKSPEKNNTVEHCKAYVARGTVSIVPVRRSEGKMPVCHRHGVRLAAANSRVPSLIITSQELQ
jgi:hypothetical protein